MSVERTKYKYPTRWHFYVIRYRMPITLFTTVGVLLGIILQGHKPHALFGATGYLGPAGLGIVLLGASLRSWAAGLIHKREFIARTGPYALTRHPLYLGSLGIAIGFVAIIGNWILVATLIAICIMVYIPKITQEEKSLEQHYGEPYRSYRNETGMFWPKRWPPDLAAIPWSFTQWRRNREYLTFLSCLIGLFGVWLWRTYL